MISEVNYYSWKVLVRQRQAATGWRNRQERTRAGAARDMWRLKATIGSAEWRRPTLERWRERSPVTKS